jgi:hypothetical protein
MKTTTMMTLNARTPVLLVLVLLVLSACAATPQESESVVDRAQLRWDSIFSRDYDTAYSLYSPGYRSTTSRTDFEIELRMLRVKWLSADYAVHECSENRCTVTFNVQYEVSKPVPGLDSYKGTSVIPGTWIKSGGEWWFVPPKK